MHILNFMSEYEMAISAHMITIMLCSPDKHPVTNGEHTEDEPPVVTECSCDIRSCYGLFFLTRPRSAAASVSLKLSETTVIKHTLLMHPTLPNRDGNEGGLQSGAGVVEEAWATQTDSRYRSLASCHLCWVSAAGVRCLNTHTVGHSHTRDEHLQARPPGGKFHPGTFHCYVISIKLKRPFLIS